MGRHCTYTWFFFFFQAEDGIRDGRVTGVQTCALPICLRGWRRWPCPPPPGDSDGTRSEERREGKSVDLGGRRIIKKKSYRMWTAVRRENFARRSYSDWC